MQNSPKNKVLAVVGPTGSGKTSLAVKLAKKYNGIIISADSRQIFKGLDIGTNKEGIPGVWEGEVVRIVEEIPQLLVDIVEPGSRFTLEDWLKEARRLLDKVWVSGKLPIVVGGTGLYVTALFEGYQPGEGRFATRKEMVGFASLVLEIFADREVLYDRSDRRFDQIFDSVVNETQQLIDGGVSRTWLESIGLDYRFATYFLTRKMNREIAIEEFKKASRHYIRRQLTWWRHHLAPVRVDGYSDAANKVDSFLKTN